MKISEKIKELRVDRALTQKRLADKLGKSESAVRMWELGKSEPDLETMQKLARVFGVDMNEMFGYPLCTQNKLGLLIKKHRQTKGLTLRDFAKLCGTSHAYIAMLENGENYKTGKAIDPNISTLVKIAKALNISIHELIDEIL